MYFSLGIPNQAHWLPETYFLLQESWQNVALVVFSAKLRILVVARLSVQGCDLNTRIVSCRRRLAPRSYRRKCQHVQSRLDLAANISYNIGFQRNASLMTRLRSTECLHSDLAIKSSQTYNINLLDVALIACSIFMLPVALITESVQHVHLIERRWQNSSRRCWWGVTCLFMGGHFSKYWARPYNLNSFESVAKCRSCETAKWQTMRIQYGYRWSRGLRCSLLCSGRERVVRRGIGFRLNFHHLQGTLRINAKLRLTHQDARFNAACSPAQLQVFLFPWSCSLWHL